MALIDNPEEIKKHNSAVSITLKLADIQSFIDDSVNQHLIPAIGRDAYDDLVAGRAGYPLNSKQSVAFLLLQKAAVGFILAYYTNSGALQITSAGITVSKGPNTLPASDKKLMVFKRDNFDRGYNNLELLVNYLEANIDDFILYKGSDEHLSNRSLLINNSSEFQKSGVNISNNAHLYQTLRTYQPDIERSAIVPVLGRALYGKLVAIILNGGGTDKEKDLINQVRRPLAQLTMLEAIPWMAISLDAGGVYQLSETVGGISGNVENRSAAETSRLQAAMMSLECRSEGQLEDIKNWLTENSADFPDYVVTETININDGSAPNVYWL